MSDSRERFEALLNEQKYILGMPKLTGAWPAFNSGYEAGRAVGVAETARRCAEVVLTVSVRCEECAAHNEHDQCDVAEPWDYEKAIKAEFPEAFK